ncbi:MAG: hypothetical protein IT342_20265 [Candidatus Melainabacteria bacterium]|nr:hypothetical protein [Candidatus Melainabacteria bacterium]
MKQSQTSGLTQTAPALNCVTVSVPSFGHLMVPSASFIPQDGQRGIVRVSPFAIDDDSLRSGTGVFSKLNEWCN